MENKTYLLPACKTADDETIGIGSEVYAVTFKYKRNKFGRLYRPSTKELMVVKVTVSTITFSEFLEPGWFGWTGIAYSGMVEIECHDGTMRSVSCLPGIEVSQYTIFASEDAAKAALEKASAGGGLYTRAGFPLMPTWQIGEVRAALEAGACCHNQPAQKLKVGDICTYSFGTENASRATVKIVKLLPDTNVATVMFLSVEKDDTGNGMFNYLLKTGKTMNASLKYLTCQHA